MVDISQVLDMDQTRVMPITFIHDHQDRWKKVIPTEGDVFRDNGLCFVRIMYKGAAFTHLDGFLFPREAEEFLSHALKEGVYLA